MAIAMLAAPAFIDATRPIFTEYRGEWALISASKSTSLACVTSLTSQHSFLLSCRRQLGGWVSPLPLRASNLLPSVSQTNFLSVHRILGTL